ncbi:MAG: nitrilase-related carbon-nitrogen hydrolase, partial [Pseudomonadota bacterium]
MGRPIARDEPRSAVVGRMVTLMHQAKDHGADLVVYPELALTTFFPRWWLDDDQSAIDGFFETSMPSNETAPLFAEAARLNLGFSFGYAELVEEEGRTRHFNTSILVDKSGEIVLKYRKVHLPGHAEHEPWRAFQHLEKRYFEVGNLGFPVASTMGGNFGMMICNDRRWSESYRVMGLQAVEMILLGYNTPLHNPPAPEHDALSNAHNALVMRAGAYQNGTFVVGVAKAGVEEGVMQIGQSQIIAPSGEPIAMATTLGDEL